MKSVPHSTSAPSSTPNGPAWNIACEYPALDSPEFLEDHRRFLELHGQIETLSTKMGPLLESITDGDTQRQTLLVAAARELNRLSREAGLIAANMGTWLGCLLSVESSNALARGVQARLRSENSRLAQALEPLNQFTLRASDELLEVYLQDPLAAESRFYLTQSRKLRDQLLSPEEETLESSLSLDGHTAWGSLYTTLAASMTVPLGGRQLGLAQAAGQLQNLERAQREEAFRAINSGWQVHRETAASILNSIAGWRHEMYARRGKGRPVHFLQPALHVNRMQPETLHNLILAAEDARPLARRALALMANALELEQLAPWDLAAPLPAALRTDSNLLSFEDAMDQVVEAYGTVSPEMARFARSMQDQGFIEGRNQPGKRTGAYCTRFLRSRTQRVFMTWSGGGQNLRTLAHELGHAFHGHVMRDLPVVQQGYPMSLAETASIFAENVLGAHTLAGASDPRAIFEAQWPVLSSCGSMLLNIPMRFTFENEFYERRSEGPLLPDQFSELMLKHWTQWYGAATSEGDPMFWANKLHFSMTGTSFYNFPYLFGFLYSLTVLNQRERLGEGFFAAYSGLLMDTGRMTVEDLSRKHLGMDVRRREFWQGALEHLETQVNHAEGALARLLPGGTR
ncbi:MAG: oligoendopeptidase F [Calditrichaeota bacterium]|nr:oligoendopeptidase F [Calditrichota bacterium]